MFLHFTCGVPVTGCSGRLAYSVRFTGVTRPFNTPYFPQAPLTVGDVAVVSGGQGRSAALSKAHAGPRSFTPLLIITHGACVEQMPLSPPPLPPAA